MRPWNFMITNCPKHLFSPDLVTFYWAINGSSLTARDRVQSFVFALGACGRSWFHLCFSLLVFSEPSPNLACHFKHYRGCSLKEDSTYCQETIRPPWDIFLTAALCRYTLNAISHRSLHITGRMTCARWFSSRDGRTVSSSSLRIKMIRCSSVADVPTLSLSNHIFFFICWLIYSRHPISLGNELLLT